MKEQILNTFRNLKLFNWSLYITLIFVALFPAIIQTVRTFFLSTTIDVSGFDVLGQMEWFDLINESIIALLIIPLYSILSAQLKKNNLKFPKQVFKASLTVILLYWCFSGLIYGVARCLVNFMNPNQFNIDAMVTYLGLETISFMLAIIPQFANVVFIVIGKKINFYIYVVVHSLLLILADYLLIPSYEVNGVAYSNILINGTLAIVMVGLLIYEKRIQLTWLDKEDKEMYKSWLKIGLPSFGQSLLDNIIYALMVAKMVNSVSSAGDYWVANNFIWLWLLIPITALGEIIRKDCSDGYKNLKQTNYYIILASVIFIWLISIPLWLPFFKYIEKLENASEIYNITLRLFGFYIAYALTIVPDNIFVGLGKTKYSLLNSFIINIIYYGIFYLIYITARFEMTLNTIIMMFGFGMVVHLSISLLEEKILLIREIRKFEEIR